MAMKHGAFVDVYPMVLLENGTLEYNGPLGRKMVSCHNFPGLQSYKKRSEVILTYS